MTNIPNIASNLATNAATPVDEVDPYIGSIGHLLTATTPFAQLPHGMAQLWPVVTGGNDRYTAPLLEGIRLCWATLTATADKRGTDRLAAASLYDHDHETATPYSYAALLEDEEIELEAAVGRRSAIFGVEFPACSAARLLLRLPAGATVETQGEGRLAIHARERGVPCYMELQLSRPWQELSVWQQDDEAGCEIRLGATTGERLELKAGLSYVSAGSAAAHLRQELGDADIETLRQRGRAVWNEALGRIDVRGGTAEQRSAFYTALYRSLLPMMNITEADGRHYSGFDGQVHEHDGRDHYTMDNLWDSYRCLHPLQLLLEPQRQADMIASYLRMYEQSGWLPQFPDLAGDRPYMSGNHAAAFFADTYAKGVRDFDVAKAYEAVRRNALEATMLPWTNNGPLTELDRLHAQLGYMPALPRGATEWVPEVDSYERRQAVSVTLEHAYDDWCAALLAEAAGCEEEARLLRERGTHYRNLFDERIGFMAPRTADGAWVPDFDPTRDGGQGGRDYFAECNAWIYTFHVQHDIEGLSELLGGPAGLEAKLDALFAATCGGAKYEFLAQFPDSTGLMGQYCQGNEPAFHIPYLYNYAGAPWKTQRKLREMMKLWFTASPHGICGDEDCGAMSSWYVWSAMGLYPVCPGKPVYDIGSPIFEEVRIALGEGGHFVIRAEGVSERNKYIQSATLNGEPWHAAAVPHEAMVGGGELLLRMGPRPNKAWGLERLDDRQPSDEQARAATDGVKE